MNEEWTCPFCGVMLTKDNIIYSFPVPAYAETSFALECWNCGKDSCYSPFYFSARKQLIPLASNET